MAIHGEPNRISDAGIDASRIAETSVLVKVDDIPADQLRTHPSWLLLRGLRGLGFGALHLCGAADYFDALDRLMSSAKFTQLPGLWITSEMARGAPDSDILVDLSNDAESRFLCRELSSSTSSMFFALTWGRTWASITDSDNDATDGESPYASYEAGREPLPPVSRIVAGLAMQEILMTAGGVELAAPLGNNVVYNVAGNDRSGKSDSAAWRTARVRDATIEIIGAGGIGIHVLESLAPLLGPGTELRIFDPDHVGPENLPLQTAYGQEDVGRPKALVMTEELGTVCDPEVRVVPFVQRYQERPRRLSPPRVRVVAPDNFAARKYANDLSVADGIPLVDAGSSPLGASQRSYHPGHSCCLACRIRDLPKKADHEVERASCSANPALTLPGTNMVIGGILAAEALRATEPERLGPVSRGQITYDTRIPERFAITDVRPPCAHGRTDLPSEA